MDHLSRVNNSEGELVLPAQASAGSRQAPFGENAVLANRPVFRLDIVNSVRLHPNLFIGVSALLFALIVMAALSIKASYDAESLVYVEPMPNKLLGDVTGFYDPNRYASGLQQQIQTVTRQDTLEEAVRSLPDGMWRRPGEPVAAAAARLGSAIAVKRVADSFQLSISSSGPNARQVAGIVNAVTDAFLNQGRKDSNANTDERLKLLGEERAKIKSDLEAAHEEQTHLSTDLGVAVSTGNSPANPYDVELSGTRSELIAAEQAHDMAVAQLAAIRDRDGNPSPGLKAQAEEAAAGDQSLGTLKSSVAARRATLNGQMAGMTPENSLYRHNQEELNQLDAQVQARSAVLERAVEQRMLAKDELEVRRTGEVESRLRAQVASGTHAASNAAPKLQRSAELTAEITRLEARYATVDDAMRSLTLEETGPGLAHLSVPATVPTAPAASKRKILLLAALPLALALGGLASVFASFLNRRVITATDLERVLGFAPTAVLPARDEVTDEAIEECLLRLAGALERAHRGAGARSFVFTPVSQATGISDLTRAIERKLLLLGFSVRRLEVDHLLRGTTSDGQSAAERLAAWMDTTDIVLFEAHPLLRSAEAEYAVSTVDATVLIVESGVATKREVTRSLNLLRRLQVLGVGVILDGVRLHLADVDLRDSLTTLERGAALPAAAEPERLEGDASPGPIELPAAAHAETPLLAEEPLAQSGAGDAMHGEPVPETVESVERAAEPEVLGLSDAPVFPASFESEERPPVVLAEAAPVEAPAVQQVAEVPVEAVAVEPVAPQLVEPAAMEPVAAKPVAVDHVADIVVETAAHTPDQTAAQTPAASPALVAAHAGSAAPDEASPVAREFGGEAPAPAVTYASMPQRYSDPMLPAWLAEALQPASAAATPFVSTPQPAAPVPLPAAEERTQTEPAEAAVFPVAESATLHALESPLASPVATEEPRASLMAWGHHNGSQTQHQFQSQAPSVPEPATVDAPEWAESAPVESVAAMDAPGTAWEQAFEVAAPMPVPFTSVVPALTNHADDAEEEAFSWTTFHPAPFADLAPLHRESPAAVAIPLPAFETAAALVEPEPVAVSVTEPVVEATRAIDGRDEPLRPAAEAGTPAKLAAEQPARRAAEPSVFASLPPVEAPTLIYERPLFPIEVPARTAPLTTLPARFAPPSLQPAVPSAPLPAPMPSAPSIAAAERLAPMPPAPLPRTVPQTAAMPQLRTRETGRVVSWTPRPALVRPGPAPGQSAIYGPGPGYGTPRAAAPAGIAETPEVADGQTSDELAPRRWNLLRRFDPRSRMFSERLNQVPVPGDHEIVTEAYDPLPERSMRNGSGK